MAGSASAAFYRLGLSGYEPANPEYRIADDVRWATEPVVDFAIGLLSAVITAITFIGILWSIGGSLSVEAHGVPFEIPAYMVLAAIIYAVLVSGLITWVGRPLPRLIAARNEGEARLRFSLMRIRDHGETIALSRAENGERRAVAATYDTLVTRWLAMIRQRGRLTWITNGSGALVPVVPLLLAAPKYLSGEMSLGDVVQVAAAFVAVQNAFNWVLDNFMRIAEWLASARRVNELAVALHAIEAGAAQSDITVVASEDGGVRLDGLTLTDRDGRTLLADFSTALSAGATLHVAGELGHGKAALIQAVAGLWPWGAWRGGAAGRGAHRRAAAASASVGGQPACRARPDWRPQRRRGSRCAAALRPLQSGAADRPGARLGQGADDRRSPASRSGPDRTGGARYPRPRRSDQRPRNRSGARPLVAAAGGAAAGGDAADRPEPGFRRSRRPSSHHAPGRRRRAHRLVPT